MPGGKMDLYPQVGASERPLTVGNGLKFLKSIYVQNNQIMTHYLPLAHVVYQVQDFIYEVFYKPMCWRFHFCIF